ncbi:MAG: hypothetical protein A2091_03290 [Desulfuromonadales bacterium GWD2_61_12]|nr:MAG: hypothetical protein A2005_06390 [Desulfuromonadales bacterium GWC2_61_20]OGR34927.1 MAG: hypothetical protein A2091_03290 [Desulfuromonadales bacterium GWD2_61_12]HAD04417.1 hypothetical protein [Desulfuromonas sp.]
MKRFLGLAMVLFSFPAMAADKAGVISKFEGKVLLYRNGGVRGDTLEHAGAEIAVGDAIATKRDATAFIRFVDGNRVIIKENSTLNIKALQEASLGSGTVLFDIRKRGGVKGFEVTSATVTMGVRGTRFAVRETEGKLEVCVKEGKVEVAPKQGTFRKHRAAENLEAGAKTMQEDLKKQFDAATSQMKAQFEESKRLLAAGDFEAVERIDLEAGSGITIDGSDAWVSGLPDWADKELAQFEDF